MKQQLIALAIVMLCVAGCRNEERERAERQAAARAALEARNLGGGADGTDRLFSHEVIHDPSLINLYLDAGVSPNASEGNLTLLMVAIREGFEPLRDRLIRAGANLDMQDEQGMTALMWACVKEKHQSAAILLDAGADPNLADKWGWTALMHATTNGQKEIVRKLLAKGADTSGVNELGWSASKIARIRRFDELAQMIPAGEPGPETQEGVRSGSLEIHPAVVDFGKVDFGSHTELEVELRLDAGEAPQVVRSRVDWPFSFEPDPLDVSTAAPAVARVRLDAPAAKRGALKGRLELTFRDGSISLPIRATVGRDPAEDRASAYRRFLDVTGDVTPRMEFLQAALRQSAAAGDDVIVRALLGAGVSPDVTMDGDSPLTIAIRNERFETVRILLEGGADPNLESRATPLEIAKGTGRDTTVTDLMKAGARE
jgi:uncharacterized protein